MKEVWTAGIEQQLPALETLTSVPVYHAAAQ